MVKHSGGLHKQEVRMSQVRNFLDVLIVIIHGVTTIKNFIKFKYYDIKGNKKLISFVLFCFEYFSILLILKFFDV